MILVSRHLLDLGMSFPRPFVIRINLAWEPSLTQLKKDIKKIKHDIFLDLPSGRTKPPCQKWTISQLIPILKNEKVKYFAISNVEDSDDILYPLWKLPRHIAIVPKIESIKGIQNIEQIVKHLRTPKIIMIDHDDLYTNLLKQKIDGKLLYKNYIDPLTKKCKKLKTKVLKTGGIVFYEYKG